MTNNPPVPPPAHYPVTRRDPAGGIQRLGRGRGRRRGHGVQLRERGRHHPQPQTHRDRVRIQEGLHGLPEGLHEEGRQVSGGQRQSRRGGHFQEEHQQRHEGLARQVQGPSVLHR